MLLSILAHHSEPGDAELLEWIKHQIDSMTGLGGLSIVIALGLLVVAIPVTILVAFRLLRAGQYRA